MLYVGIHRANSPNWNKWVVGSKWIYRSREIIKLATPTMKAVTFTSLSLLIIRRRSAPTRGRKMVVERIGKLREFIIR